MAPQSFADDRYRDRVLKSIYLLYKSDDSAAKGTDEVQTVTISGTPTGGAFTLTFGGQTTQALPYNATAAQVSRALEDLASIGWGNVLVTGGPGPGTPYVVTFLHDLGSQNVALMTAANTFTGGTTPAVAVAETTPGVAGATIKRLKLDSRGFASERDLATLTTEGTEDILTTNRVNARRASFDQSKWQQALALIAQQYSTGNPGEAQRVWDTGDFKTTQYGLEVWETAVDVDDGVQVRFRTVYPRVQVQDYDEFAGGAARQTVIPGRVIFNMLKGTTDLFGTTITNVPADGIFGYRAKLAA